MIFTSTDGCCSMAQMHDVDFEDLFFEFETADQLISRAQEEVDSDIKTIMYCTNFGIKRRKIIEKKFGFVTVYSYKGNNGQVHVMFLN